MAKAVGRSKGEFMEEMAMREKGMETVIFRPMRAEEAEEVQALGKRSFPFTEGLVVGLPKEAIVAELGSRKVGGVMYTISGQEKKRIG